MKLRNLLLGSLLFVAACVPVVSPRIPPPPPPAYHQENFSVTSAVGSVADGAIASVVSDGGVSIGDTSVAGRVTFNVPAGLTGGATLTVIAPTYAPYVGRYVFCIITCEQPAVQLGPAVPPAPTREEALNIQSHDMQGLECDTSVGRLHWWGAATAWLSAADRQLIYACKHAVGDTHIIIQLPTGHPLYDECCNDYSPDRFPALSWLNPADGSFDGRLAALVVEVRQAGFIPIVFPTETPDQSYSEISRAIIALQTSPYGDISHQVGLYMIGWDGVFYGPWTREQVEGWPVQVRVLCPLCQFGLEFNTGHIPQEAGWNMSGFDALLVEFDFSVHTWNNWQIVPRLMGPQRYNKPADDDSPQPVPRMPMSTPRGDIQTVCFEWKTYPHVRGQATLAEEEADRQYLRAEGCPTID